MPDCHYRNIARTKNVAFEELWVYMCVGLDEDLDMKGAKEPLPVW